MRPFGYSTGSLADSKAFAYDDFGTAVDACTKIDATAVELSALRTPELETLSRFLATADLSSLDHRSIHAPSKFDEAEERQIVATLSDLTANEPTYVVAHPDSFIDWSIWQSLGTRLLVENMDRRKPIGRTASEMADVFTRLPDAGFCLDLGHARQIDPTMLVAIELIGEFGGRLGQIHMSEVTTSSRHVRMTWGATESFRSIRHRIPKGVPVILETPTPLADLKRDLTQARFIFGEEFVDVDVLDEPTNEPSSRPTR